jgi:23S rRNA (adenine2030-N6)-methyltransferase
MLSYRHAFHAGNHADVLKHLVLVQLLSYLTRKDKPFWYIDTHAGAGLYALGAGLAAGHDEYTDGIGRLWLQPDLPAALAEYVALVRRANPEPQLRRYPGSPWIAQTLTREQDRLWLCELHPADFALLTESFVAPGNRIHVARVDGLAELRRLLPPAPRRALVMIDPSYEQTADYTTLVDAVADSLKRFATGVFAIWYPMLRSREAERLPARLRKLKAGRWLDVRLTVRSRRDERPGLFGSGVYVINPPHTLTAALADAMPILASLLALDDTAGFELAHHSP